MTPFVRRPEVDIARRPRSSRSYHKPIVQPGWCAMIGCDGGFYSPAMDDEVGCAVYPDLDAVTQTRGPLKKQWFTIVTN
jgi:indole-3-acetate monooxygenase